MTADVNTAPTALTSQQLERVVATAVLAPSVHNTQPWSFRPQPYGLDVRADRSRQLLHQDPDSRELHVSCGAATQHAALAVRGLGLGCVVEWLPEPGDADLLARLVVGPPGEPASADDAGLLAAAGLRHTDRSAFSAEPVGQDVVDALRLAAEREGAWLADEQDPDRAVRLAVLVSRADDLLRRDAGVRDDVRAWVSGAELPSEGVPAGALPEHGGGRGSTLTLRDFDPAPAPPAAGDEPPTAERPLLLVLGTDGDARPDWLQAGAALGRVLLAATARGLVANPQTQVLEVPSLRRQLSAELGLTGHPQLVLRAGWPTGPGSPRTARRPVSDVLG